MNVEEAARFLQISVETLRRWMRQGLIHASRMPAGTFDPEDLARWARRRGIARHGSTSPQRTPPANMLAAAVSRGAISVGAQPRSASEAIALAVSALKVRDTTSGDALLAQILERERMASTGLGHGVALPHPRTPPGHLFRDPVVSVVFLDQPVDWAALDGEAVHTVMLLLSPSAPVHLEILSRVAYALRTPEFSEFLRSQPDQNLLVERLNAIKSPH